jgi:hypothetical protein
MFIHMCRNASTVALRSEMCIRIQAERHSVETQTVPGASKATWNESFTLHIYDEQSPITVSIVVNGHVMGSNSFSVFRSYIVGKPSKMWFPTPGELMPHAEVSMVIELLPPPPQPK